MKTALHQEQPMIEKVANLNVICHPELSLSLFYRKLSLSLKILASHLFQIQHGHKGSGFAISLYQCLLKQPLQNQTLRLLYAKTNWSQWMKYDIDPSQLNSGAIDVPLVSHCTYTYSTKLQWQTSFPTHSTEYSTKGNIIANEKYELFLIPVR